MTKRTLPVASVASGGPLASVASVAIVPTTRDWRRTTFGPFAKRVLFAMAEAFFTDPDDPPDRGALQRFSWLIDDMDDFISQASPALRFGTRAAALLVELAPVFFIWRFSRCSSLPLPERERYLAKVEASRVPRVAVFVVMFKTLMTVLYFEHPEAASHLGYDGRHERFRAARSSLPPDEDRS